MGAAAESAASGSFSHVKAPSDMTTGEVAESPRCARVSTRVRVGAMRRESTAWGMVVTREGGTPNRSMTSSRIASATATIRSALRSIREYIARKGPRENLG